MLNINLFYELGIDAKAGKPSQKVKCPNCEKLGHKKHNDTPLSINLINGLYNCHRCGWKGSVKIGEKSSQYQYPIKKNFTKINDDAVSLFTNRGITQEVIISNKIAQEGGWVVFPYLRNEILVNIKKRSIKDKDFRQGVDCEPIIYNYDRVKDKKEIIICEGEFDCMAFEVAGFTNTTSVNQGAPNEKDKNCDKKLECITNCYEVFEQAEVVYIAVDKDNNGKRLEIELIRRIGAEKCKVIDFPSEYKDANDVLIYEGKDILIECYKNAKDVKVTGVFTVDDVSESMLNTFEKGKKRGTTTYFSEFDRIWTHRTGEVTLWTGYMNEGKSTFIKQLLLLLAVFNGTKTGVFSPEEFPADEFYDDLIHSFIGKATDRYYKNVMNRLEYEKGMEFVKKNFFYIYPEEDFLLESIFKKMIYLIRKYGIRNILLDPYNQFDHTQGNMQIDQYVSKFMSKLKRFALIHDVAIHLVAHQVTPVFVSGEDYPRPNAYKIKGGGTFADKADNVGFVWIPKRYSDRTDRTVLVGFDKVKKKRLVGEGGDKEFKFNIETNRYEINSFSPFENNTPKQTSIHQNTEFITEIPKGITDIKYKPQTDVLGEEINMIVDNSSDTYVVPF